MRVKLEWYNEPEFLADLDKYQRKLANALLDGLKDVLNRVKDRANEILRSTKSPFVVPQRDRYGLSRQAPIEESWELILTMEGDNLEADLANTSQHAEAVEYGTIGTDIRAKIAPAMVWDTRYPGLGPVVVWPKEKGSVHGQLGKGYLTKASEELKPQIQSILSKYINSI